MGAKFTIFLTIFKYIINAGNEDEVFVMYAYYFTLDQYGTAFEYTAGGSMAYVFASIPAVSI